MKAFAVLMHENNADKRVEYFFIFSSKSCAGIEVAYLSCDVGWAFPMYCRYL